MPSSSLIKYVISAIVVCCVLTICVVAGRYFFLAVAQQSLNNSVKAESISGATPYKFGLCPNIPTAWTAQKFTNGTYCIQPGSTATTDSKGNLTGAIIGPCTKPLQTINGMQYCVTSQ